jgi:CheY-like chemotaxis protein
MTTIDFYDDDRFRRVVHVMLTTAGYTVQEAANGTIGLASYREQRSDVVMTDIPMPEREGLETIRALKKAPCARVLAPLYGTRAGDEAAVRIEQLGRARGIALPAERLAVEAESLKWRKSFAKNIV